MVDKRLLEIDYQTPPTSNQGIVFNAATGLFVPQNLAILAGPLVSGRVVLVNATGQLTDDADLTFNTDTLTATKLKVSGLTSGRVVLATTGGELTDDGDLTFSGSTLTATTFSGGNVTSGVDPGHTHTAYHPTTAPTMSNWTPSYSAGGSMTYTSVTTTRARYGQLGKLVWIDVQCTGTTGGTADNDIFISGLPVTAAAQMQALPAVITDGLSFAGIAWISAGTTLTVRRYDASNYGLGSGRAIRVTGCYEAA